MPINELVYRKLLTNQPGYPSAAPSTSKLLADLPDELLDLWFDDYLRTHANAEMVTVTLDENGSSFTYLFDTTRQRTIGVVGIPAFVKHKRDAGRMAGHPLSQGPTYHRGHLMAHSIGGGADINLVPQLAKLNIGKFRVIERLVRKLASENVKCLYFVRTVYTDDTATQTNLTQLPDQLEQGVVLQSGQLVYAMHTNV